MSNGLIRKEQYLQLLYRCLVAALLTGSSLISQYLLLNQAALAATDGYCRFTSDAITEKETLRQKSLKGNVDAQKYYKEVLKKHADLLQQCRNQTWPRTQAIWVRLYPCDIRPGFLDDTLDRIVNLGYNQINVEVFYDGQVLLPAAENTTPWPSIIRTPGKEKVDLLAQTIQKGRERGLRVYAWMFTMNFGYSYAQRSDRKGVLAMNGKGQNSLAVVDDGNQVFIDPYNRQAQIDYYQLVDAVAKKRPDGILFDYIRYPRQSGSDSVASKTEDLWIYSDAIREALYARALNSKGKELIERFVSRGYVTAEDIAAVDKMFPQEGSPLWQGRTPPTDELKATAAQRKPLLQWELWQLSVAHAVQGVLDFLAIANLAAQRQGVTTGAVFFPDGNQSIGQGYDSRLQAWERFPSSIEWHPMSYATCGYVSCITGQVQRVVNMASPGTQIMPVLAGVWGKSVSDRPSLEAQMQAIRQFTPQVNGISHFAYSWQYPEMDRDRKFCRLE